VIRCAIAYWVIALIGAAVLTAPAASECEYRTVFVDAARPAEITGEHVQRISAQRHMRLLTAARAALPELGLVATDSEAAFWRLSAHGGAVEGSSRIYVSIELDAGVRLQNDIFIARLDREDFPYRGEAGGAFSFDIAPDESWESVEARVGPDLAALWAREAEQVAALCALRGALAEEGWRSIGELRLELIGGIERTRQRERAVRKQLELEVEVEAEPPR